MSLYHQGFGGHFICADRCAFRMNTAVNGNRIIVSTVGAMRKVIRDDGEYDTIGATGKFETMVFHAMPCADEGCDCGSFVQVSGQDLSCERCDTARDAREMHMRTCEEWDAMGSLPPVRE